MIDKVFQNKPLLMSFLAVLVLLILFLLFLSIRDISNRFRLESVSPNSGATIDPESIAIVFDFNQEMPLVQADTFEVLVEPEVGYIYGVLGDKIQITLSDLLLIDNQAYTVKVSNILSRSNEVIRNVSTSFTVDLEQDAVDFLNSLPLTEEGFNIVKVSDDTLYIRVIDNPEGRYRDEAIDLLNEAGLFSAMFNVDISLPSEQFDFDEGGIRHAH